MLTQRRRHSRWRSILVLLVFIGLIRHSELAPAGLPESSSTSVPAARKRSQDIGSLSDFTWQAWLLVDTQSGSQPGMDSATLLRRITPKSVFIAPALPACAEGYRADTMDRCVKSVNIDESAHIGFLLQRLNALYANQDVNNGAQSAASTGSKSDEKSQSSGPLQLNIPLLPDSKSQSADVVELDDSLPINEPAEQAAQVGAYSEKKAKPQESTVTVYEVKNDTASNGEESTLFPANSSVGDAETEQAAMEEETNDTNFSQLLDYKIPASVAKEQNVSDDEAGDDTTTTDKRQNSTDASPALVLFLSSTKLPNVIANSNFTSNLSVSLPDSVLPLTNQSDQQVETLSIDGNDQTQAANKSKLKESQEAEFVYDDEEEEEEEQEAEDDNDDDEYTYGTDVPDEDEDSTEAEAEEILKHGEAGMTIPMRNIQRLHQQNQTEHNKTLDIRDRIVIRFNDSASIDEADSNVSSVVSIDGDVILETTLLNVNTERLRITTNAPNHSSSPLLDKIPNSESQVSYLPDETSHATTTTALYEREEPSSSERNTNAKATNTSTESWKESRDASTANDSKRTSSSSIGPTNDDYVRFPDDYAIKPTQGFVRFPFNQANSIHSQGYKQHLQYSSDDGAPYGSTSTKSSVPVRQKPVYYLTAPSWKPDRYQSDRVSPTATQRQKQRPVLLRFWSKMPLVRDPGIHSIGQMEPSEPTERSHNRFLGTSPPRRVSFYREMSPRDMDKVFTQKLKTPQIAD